MTGPSEQIVDEILVMDCQSGRSQALDMLVGRWQKRLWRYACRLTGNPEAAWEVTQESWLGIVRGIRRLNDPARFRPWAYRIVTNKANDWIKKKSKRATAQTDELIDKPSRDDRQANETSADLQAILRRLGERSRTVLTLYYLEEFGLAEIARILGVPAGTVKSRLHTARAEFKRQWQAANETTTADTPAQQKGATK
jgi:RNA polymerase sigma factor (sigma-70 family)